MTNSLITKFFAYAQIREQRLLYQSELKEVLGISLKQEQDLLSRLTRKSLIIRLKRGVYLIPSKIPPGGKWQPNSLYLISYFMEVMQAQYYISGLYAFNYYRLSEQIPNIITIYNDKISGTKRLGVLTVNLIKVSKSRIGNPTSIKLKENRVVYIATLARTIVDAVMDWNRFGTLPDAFDWIHNHLDDNSFSNDLVKTVLKYGNISTRRRVGYYLFKLTNNPLLVKPILKSLTLTKNWVPLNPEGGTKGKTSRTWRIIDNVSTRYKSN